MIPKTHQAMTIETITFICSPMTLAIVVAVEREVVEEMVGRVKGVEMWGAENPLRGCEKKEADRVLGPRAGEESGELFCVT